MSFPPTTSILLLSSSFGIPFCRYSPFSNSFYRTSYFHPPALGPPPSPAFLTPYHVSPPDTASCSPLLTLHHVSPSRHPITFPPPDTASCVPSRRRDVTFPPPDTASRFPLPTPHHVSPPDAAVEQAQVYSIYYSSTLILPVMGEGRKAVEAVTWC